jgi:lipoprotein-anchoring transpeptidase ErfK/SrfK
MHSALTPVSGSIRYNDDRTSGGKIAMTRFPTKWLWAALLVSVFADTSRAGEPVRFSGAEPPGTIVVRTNERRLYLVTEPGRALRYTVGVGRAGKHWYGTTVISRKQLRPAWSPPAEIRGNRPAWVVPAGSPQNPMGAAALVLADNELAIHGTNNPGSIGGFVSWGCIRMHNRDILELYEKVNVGTRVVLMK